jgi:hypothetical protein
VRTSNKFLMVMIIIEIQVLLLQLETVSMGRMLQSRRFAILSKMRLGENRSARDFSLNVDCCKKSCYECLISAWMYIACYT